MSSQSYERLLEYVATQAGFDPERLAREQAMQFNGVRLDFSHLEMMNLMRISVLLDPMADDGQDILRILLEGNAQPVHDMLCVMSLDQASGRPQVHFHLPLIERSKIAISYFVHIGLPAYLDEWRRLWQELDCEQGVRSHQLA